MKCKNILIEKFEFIDFILYIDYYFYYQKEKKNYGEIKTKKKKLKFKNVRKISHHFSHDYLNLIDEFTEVKEEIGNRYFTKIFYRSREKNKIYIFDQIDSFIIIEFNEEKEWNYREQKN